MTVFTPKFGMGASVTRLEDRSFLTGRGRYTGDIVPQDGLHGYVLRSPIAKGTFRIVSTEAAKAARRVHLVLTGADLVHLGDLTSTVMQRQPDGTRAPTRDIPILCRDRVAHVGDAVAFVVAESRGEAQDAAELIEVEYDAEAGAGEAGTIGAPPAVLSAVTDALWTAYGIDHIKMPTTPSRVWSAIHAATQK